MVKRVVDSILKKANREGKKKAIDIEAIAREYGVVVRAVVIPDDIAGILNREEGAGTSILVNECHSRERQRYTVAHQLGHYLCDPGVGIHIDTRTFWGRGSNESEMERRANEFARGVLIPEGDIQREWQERVGDGDIVDREGDIVGDMASHFGVSVSVIVIRVIELGLIKAG